MNFAFPALLVLLLILPGVVFRYYYARGPWGWASPTSLRSITDELAYSVIIAVGLHAFWGYCAAVFNRPLNIGVLLPLLIGNFGKDSQILEGLILVVERDLDLILAYFLSLFFFSAVLGLLAHWLVRRYQMDLRWSLFRFENPWWYLLRGEALAIGGTCDRKNLPDGVFATSVIEQGKDAILYWGIINDFEYGTDGKLDRIILSDAHRRKLTDDREIAHYPTPSGKGPDAGPVQQRIDATTLITSATSDVHPLDERYYSINGDYLILQYSQVKTLNLDYFWLEAEDSDSSEHPATQPRTLQSSIRHIFVALIDRMKTSRSAI